MAGSRPPRRRAEGVPARRAAAAIAGLRGDLATARRYLGDDAPEVRAAALGALVRLGELHEEEAVQLLRDPSPLVRRTACELSVPVPIAVLIERLADEPPVAEAAAFALGERGDPDAAEALAAVAIDHDDPLCREAAVAALGAIGSPASYEAVLAALADQPAIRRRAVIALAAFPSQETAAALRARLGDRDWQVRQAAEDILSLIDEVPG